MIIRLKDNNGGKLLVGKEMPFERLRDAAVQILEKYGENDFVTVFCSKFGYRELQYYDGNADYMIDLDAKSVFVTSRSFPRELDGANVLYYTDRGDFVPVYYAGGGICRKVFYLAVCKYQNDDCFYIIHLDEGMEAVADSCFESFDACKKCMNEYNVKWYEFNHK